MKDYKKILEGVVNIINTTEKSDIGFVDICSYISENCPELKESEDERIRKSVIAIINNYVDNSNTFKPKMIAWLESKVVRRKQLYVRFGDIPSNEKSKIYRGEEEIGDENGVSVYSAFELNGNIVLGLTLPITKTTLHTQQHLLEYDNRPCYLVTGDYVGKGTDGEPLIKNVRIIKEIKPYRIKQDKENNTYVIKNTPNCGISVYHEKLKGSEDERIRKSLLCYFSNTNTKWFANTKREDIIEWLEKQSEPVEINPTEFDTRLQALIGKFDNLPKEELIGSLSFWLNVVQNDGTYKDEEKQGEKQQKTLVWKHWKNGIAGNGEGEPIYLIKYGLTYSISSCLGFECDYIELSELDKLLSEKQGKTSPILSNSSNIGKDEQKPSWSEEDEKNLQGILDEIEANKSSAPDYDLETYDRFLSWLESLKQRIGV